MHDVRRPRTLLTAEQLAALERMGKKSAANLVAGDRQEPKRRALARASRHRHPPRRRGRRARAGPGVRLDGGAARGVGRGTCRRCLTSGRSSRRPVRGSSTSRRNAAMIDRLAERGVKMEDAAGAGRADVRADAGRPDVRHHRHARRHEPRGGRAGDPAARRARSSGSISRRPRRWSWAATPAASSRRPGHSACRSSMKPRFWPL